MQVMANWFGEKTINPSPSTRLVINISSRNPLRGFEANIYDGFDWALVELGDATFHCANEVALPQVPQRHPKHLFLERISVSPPSGEVLGVTRRGIVKGFATGSACSIKLSNSSLYREVWSVQLENTHGLSYSFALLRMLATDTGIKLEVGDSGSWVIDPMSGDVHGVIIAGSRYLREVYIIPTAEIFKDIGRKLQAVNVALPTMEGTLHLASRHGNYSLVQRLLESHVNISRVHSGWTALHTAAGGGYLEVVKILLDAGANVNAAAAAGREGRTALQAAAGGGHLEVVRMLLDAGAHVNAAAERREGRTALQAAAGGGHLEVVRMLLDAGANVNATAAGYGDQTALQAAATRGRLEVVRMLLDAGANVNATAAAAGREGRTALQAAAGGGHLEVVRMLLDARRFEKREKTE
jgi:hypothetical protein